MRLNTFSLFTLTLTLIMVSGASFAHGISNADQASILHAGYLEYSRLGAKHMLTGYDHLLFLFGIVFLLSKFKDIVSLVSAFTIGHSITLILATIFEISANYHLIDAVIALTVCYKAFDNLDGFKKYLNTTSPNLVVMVFIFGLIHGFGLSTRLQQLPLGHDNLILKILSFNIGVELGQIAALSIMLLLLSSWRSTESFQRFSKATNIILLITGGCLCLMQLYSYQYS